MKHHLENKKKPSAAHVLAIVHYANNVKNWEAALHLLQIIPLLKLEKEISEDVEASVQHGLITDCISCMHKSTPSLRTEALFLCKKAIEIENRKQCCEC